MNKENIMSKILITGSIFGMVIFIWTMYTKAAYLSVMLLLYGMLYRNELNYMRLKGK